MCTIPWKISEETLRKLLSRSSDSVIKFTLPCSRIKRKFFGHTIAIELYKRSVFNLDKNTAIARRMQQPCMQLDFLCKPFARGKFFTLILDRLPRFAKILRKRPGRSIVRLSVSNVYRMSTRCPIVRLTIQDVYMMFLERHYAGQGHCITSVYYVTPKR